MSLAFRGGSLIAQELALRHPELVRSLVLISTWARPDAYFRAMTKFWHWLVEVAPSERAMLEAFFLWIYTPHAHADGTQGKRMKVCDPIAGVLLGRARAPKPCRTQQRAGSH